MIKETETIRKTVQKRAASLIIFMCLIAPLAFMASACRQKVDISKAQELYQCSMHPNVVSEKPEDCPICGMRLTLTGHAAGSAGTAESGEKSILYYRHPMRPDVSSPVPAKDEMGMDYIPVYSDETSGGSPAIPGHGAIVISPERQQLIGVKTGRVESRDLKKTVRAVGQVVYDKALFDALMAYRGALAWNERELKSTDSVFRDRGKDILTAAESKLKLLGYGEKEAEEFLKAAAFLDRFPLPSGFAGVVTEIYEYEMALVKPDQAAEIRTPAFPGRIFKGKVIFSDPLLNAKTRTVSVRTHVEDAEGELRPGMFVDVHLEVPLGVKTALPENALFNTGDRQLVFVDKGEGHFEPREVRLGQEAGGYYEILSGVEEGESVVTSANFLIDSESRFQAAAQNFKSQKAAAGEK